MDEDSEVRTTGMTMKRYICVVLYQYWREVHLHFKPEKHIVLVGIWFWGYIREMIMRRMIMSTCNAESRKHV